MLAPCPLPTSYGLPPAAFYCSSRGEEYKLLWPEKAEFVRLAAASGAIIVPFAAVGIADRYRAIHFIEDGYHAT